MSTAQSQAALPAELEAIASAAHDQLHAQAGQDLSAQEAAQRHVAEAASAAITSGAALAAIADAEREGDLRARRELSGDVLRQLARAAKRKREADREYEQAIARAGRLGLSHRELAAAGAAEVSHGTVRAILTRATASLNGNEPQAAEEESTSERRHRAVSPGSSTARPCGLSAGVDVRGAERPAELRTVRFGAAGEPVGQVIAIPASGRQVDDPPAHTDRLEVARDPSGRLAARVVTIEHD
jgi:hypothetical protein